MLSPLAHRNEVGLTDGRLLVDGAWRAAADGVVWTHRNAATGEEIGRFPVATVSDVDAAGRAARRAFDEGGWPGTRATTRIRLMHRYANLLREHAAELRGLQALDNGVPLSFSANIYATGSRPPVHLDTSRTESWMARCTRVIAMDTRDSIERVSVSPGNSSPEPVVG
ncbi:aldehyde dehydrogenase family protein [Actinophytocola sp.]|uniref:aldehyde dehydrogenase family protein n=1 Tax=Actinophytocola sp. TaxID=1872138 RepID=UPI003D6B6572